MCDFGTLKYNHKGFNSTVPLVCKDLNATVGPYVQNFKPFWSSDCRPMCVASHNSSPQCKKVVSDILGKIEFSILKLHYENMYIT